MIRILVSCDDTFAYERIARHFNDGKIWAVDDGAVATNAVAKAIELRPNIAILEISATDRLELIKCMKSALPHTVVFVVTAHSAIQIESRALACGAEAVFQMDESESLMANIHAIEHSCGAQLVAPWRGIHAV